MKSIVALRNLSAILLVLASTSSAFAEGAYDLTYSTYFGGSAWEHARDVFVDAAGNVYVCGDTASRDFPTTPGTVQPTFQGYDGGGYGGFQNGFVAKLSPDGSTLVWASYIGVAQLCRDIAIDDQGNAYVALQTSSTGFPTTAGVLQVRFGGGGEILAHGSSPGGHPSRRQRT